MVCFQSPESPALSVESPVADQYPRVRVSMPRPPDTDGDNNNNINITGGDSDAPADTSAADAESTEPAEGDSGPSQASGQASGQASTARTEMTSNLQPVTSSSSLQPPSNDIITSNSLRTPPSSDIITSNSLRSPYSRFSNYQLVDSKPQVRYCSISPSLVW